MKLVFADRGWDTLWETVAGLPFIHPLSPAHAGLKHPVPESGRLRSDGLPMGANVGSYRSQGARGILSFQCVKEEESSDPGRQKPSKTCCLPKRALEQSSKASDSS